MFLIFEDDILLNIRSKLRVFICLLATAFKVCE